MPSQPLATAVNPFEDEHMAPSLQTETETETESSPAVLIVDRNATLTLGTDALIVLDEGLRHRREVRNICGLFPQLSRTTRAIAFYNILWAELDGFEVIIRYAHHTDKRTCVVRTISYAILEKTEHASARNWVNALMNRAYPTTAQRQKRIKVLVNPFGGKGRAQRIWTKEVEPIMRAAQCKIDVEQTGYKAHAVEIAKNLTIDDYDVVACASGDGLPHEVFNGLAQHREPRRALKDVAVTQIPCGSGNAMSWNLFGTDSPSLAAVAIVKGVRSPMDLMAVTQGTERYYSFLSQAVGIVAESDLGTESIRWMGNFRFTWGILIRLLGKTIYPAEIAVAEEIDDIKKIGKEYRRAVRELEARSADPASYFEDPEANSERQNSTDLPPLRFGTVTDPLPSTFTSKDFPDLGNFYVGKMCVMTADTPFFTASLPRDGYMDMINISGLLSRFAALKMLTTVGQGNLPNLPDVHYRKVSAYRIIPRTHEPDERHQWRAKVSRWLSGAGKQKEGLIAVDGESVPFQPFQVEVMPGLATVLSKRRGLYEYEWTKAP